MHNPKSVQENQMHKFLWDFEIQTDHLIVARWPDIVIVTKKNKKTKKKKTKKIENLLNSELCYFSSPQSENERKRKVRQLPSPCLKNKQIWNMKVTVVPIVISALGTISKGLVQRLEDLEIREQVDTIQTIALLRSARIPREVLGTWGDFVSLKHQRKVIN